MKTLVACRCGSTDLQNIGGVQSCIQCGTQLTGRQESNSLDTFMLFGPEEEIQIPLNAVSGNDEVFQTFSHENYQKPNFCFNCGKELQYNAVTDIKFCPQCGASQIQTYSPVQSTTFQDFQARKFSPKFGTSASQSFQSRNGSFSVSPYERKPSNQQRNSMSNLERNNSTDRTSYPNSIGVSEVDPNFSCIEIPYSNNSAHHQSLSSYHTPLSCNDLNRLFELNGHSNESTEMMTFGSSFPGNDTSNVENPQPVTLSGFNRQILGDEPQLFEIPNDCPMIDQHTVHQQNKLMEDSNGFDAGQVLDEIDRNSICLEGNTESSNNILIETNQYGDTRLHSLIQEDQTEEAIKEIQRLERTYDEEIFKKYLNKRNEYGLVPIHSAVRNPRIMDNLLQNGADITLLDYRGNNLLHQLVFTFSSEENVLRLFRVVFQHQAIYENELNALLNDSQKAYNSDGFTVVHELTKRCFGDVLEFVKEKGANLNMRDRKEKQTALVQAAKERNWMMVLKLISLHACINIPTSSGWYAVFAAIEDRNLEILKIFMEKGVDIYAIKQMDTTEEIRKMCNTYMRKRRRKHQGQASGSTRQRQRCDCGSSESMLL